MNNKTDQSFPRQEKLKNKKQIDLLFEKGKWQTCGALRLISYVDEHTDSLKFGVSVSKRYFKKATDRNRIKRLLREAYRLNKECFIQKFGTQSIHMIFYVGKEKPKHFSEIEDNFLRLCASTKNN